MSRDYPHIGDTSFPDISNVDVYKYKNEYDYDLYTDSVTIKLLNVSWCSDYENTVYFESKNARDTWFDSQDGISKELSSMFRLYNDGSIKVDIPVDECMQYNYCMIDYGKLPQQTTATKDSKMFYFISGIVQQSVNATELMLSVDYWTSYINDMNIQYVNLTRGHWPMEQTTVEEYLTNPIDNSEYLLTDDVSYGTFNRVSSSDPIILNDSSDQYLCFASNGYLDESEDNDTNWNGKVFTREYMDSELISNVCCYAINLVNWGTFKSAITTNCQQFWQTVKSMFICPARLLTFSQTGISFCGQTMAKVTSTGSKEHATRGLTKDAFGYSGKSAEIAKLYTYPYAAIEVNDFKGNSMMIKVEDTCGQLKLNTVMSDMYPFINVEAYFNGIGSGTTSTINFMNMANNTLTAGGKFYDFTTKWNIPVFAVQLTADSDWALNGNLHSTAVRENAELGAFASKGNALDSADVTRINGLNSGIASKSSKYLEASTSKDNSYDSAATAKENTNLHVGANDDNTATAVQASKDTNTNNVAQAVYVKNYNQTKMDDDMESTNYFIGASTDIQNVSNFYISANNANAQLVQSAVSAVAGSFGSDSGETGSSGIMGGFANFLFGGFSSTNIQSNQIVATTNSTSLSDLMQTLNDGKNTIAKECMNKVTEAINTLSTANVTVQTGAQSTMNTRTNTMLNGVADNNKTLAEGNADRTYTASTTNADRMYALTNGGTVGEESYGVGNVQRSSDLIKSSDEYKGNALRNYALVYGGTVGNETIGIEDYGVGTATRSWTAAYNQTVINNHPQFGQLTGTPDLIDKPFGFNFNIITQSKNAIRQAAEQFMRYGYYLNMEVDITSFNVMPNFTYWQCDKVYCNDRGVFGGAQDVIKSILNSGTTVWRDPAKIGVTSIYDNIEVTNE